MPRYQVTAGSTLPHEGQVLEAGACVELPRHVAEDVNIRGRLQAVDAEGQPLPAVPVEEDLARFRAHERVSILQERLTAARGVVAALEAQLARDVAAAPPAIPDRASSPVSEPQPPAASRGVKE